MSLINTRLQNFRPPGQLDKWETRPSRYGALDLFMTQSSDPAGIITQEMRDASAKAMLGTAIQIPVLDDPTVTISNVTLPVTISGSELTSELVTLTFVNYYFGFLIHPAKHTNNQISIQQDFNKKLTAYIYKLASDLEAASVTALETAKTQILADTLGKYTLTSNVAVSPLANQDEIIGDINGLFSGNDFYAPIHIVANPSMESHVRNRLMEKGQYNTENKTYQYADKTFHFTNAITNAVGHKASAFAVQAGSLGMLQQFAPDCQLGYSTHNAQFSKEFLPVLGMEIGTYSYDDVIDASAIAGAASAHLTATKVEAYGFHTAIAFITPYNSDPASKASPVMKVAIADS